MNKSRNIMALILIFCMIVLPGCSKSSAEKKPSDSNGQKTKAPTQLKTISTDLDTIISELDKKFKLKKMAPMQQNIQLIPQTQSGQSQTGQSQGSQSQSGQSQGNQSQSGQSQTGQSQSNQSQGSQLHGQSTDWQKEFSTLKNLHTTWNTLMPEAVSAGMSVSSRDQFDKALEQLTQDISKQNLEESLADALILYKNYADLTSLFTTQVPAEFYQVKYEIMTAIFESSRKKWSTADEHIPKIKEHWVYFSAQAKDADAKLLSQTSFAISDLEKAIQSKQMELVIIKGEIAMTNLKSLEEKLSAQSSDQGQSSSQSQAKS